MLTSNYFYDLPKINRFKLRRLALIIFFVIVTSNYAHAQEIDLTDAACASVLQSARITSNYYLQNQLAKAEVQHRATLNLLRQLRSLDMIRCSLDAQWMFPLDGKKYPAYITDYSTIAFEEAVRTGNVEHAAALLAQRGGILFSKNLFPQTMQAFREFGTFYDPFTIMNVFEKEDEMVRKAQLFKDVARRYTRFMYRTYSLLKHRPLCVQNDCLHLGWEMQEKIKSRLFRAQILTGSLLRLNEVKRNEVKNLLRQEKELKLKRNQFYFSSRNFKSPTPYDRELQITKTQIINLVPEYRELASEIATPEDISKILTSNETVLSFFYSDKDDKEVYVWKIEHDTAPELIELKVTIEKLMPQIEDLKKAMENGASLEDLKPSLAVLQNELINPLNLASDRKLIIAVDQNLSKLPFDILPWGPQGMMLDAFDIRYVPSATFFYYLRKRAAGTEPGYKIDYAGFSYQELDYANTEIGRAGIGFGSSPPNIIQKNATEADLYRNSEAINNARYLHLVTHTNPLDGIAGGFYLPFTKGDGEDGQLTSYEIASKLKNHAELVVLSACQTATSNENLLPSGVVQVDPEVNGERSLLAPSACLCNYGESFSNLSGSFFAAGSKKLLLTQWLIRDDETTAEFVKRVFDLLRAGKKPGDALRLAKTQMRDDRTEKFLPVSWAGFILAGD